MQRQPSPTKKQTRSSNDNAGAARGAMGELKLLSPHLYHMAAAMVDRQRQFHGFLHLQFISDSDRVSVLRTGEA